MKISAIMLSAHKIYSNAIRKNTINILILLHVLISCADDTSTSVINPPCDHIGNSFAAYVSENGQAYTFSTYCDAVFVRSLNAFGTIDSISVKAGWGSCYFAEGDFIEIKLYNVISKGQYALGTERASRVPYAVCSYHHLVCGYGGGDNYYMTSPKGSGIVIIDSLSSRYIKGTFNGVLWSKDSINKADITSGSFSLYPD